MEAVRILWAGPVGSVRQSAGDGRVRLGLAPRAPLLQSLAECGRGCVGPRAWLLLRHSGVLDLFLDIGTKMAHMIQNTLHTGLLLGDSLCYEQLLGETTMSRVLLNHYKASAELGDQEEDGRICEDMAVEEELEQFGFGKPFARQIRTGMYTACVFHSLCRILFSFRIVLSTYKTFESLLSHECF